MSAIPSSRYFDPFSFFGNQILDLGQSSRQNAQPLPTRDVDHPYHLIKEHHLDNPFLSAAASTAQAWLTGSVIYADMLAIAEIMVGLDTPTRRTGTTLLADSRKILKMNGGLILAYKDAFRIERERPALSEYVHDFKIDKKNRNGEIPPTKFESEVIKDFPNHRLWKLTGFERKPDTPALLLGGPNSGTQIDGMNGPVWAARRAGYDVFVIGPRDPRILPVSMSYRYPDTVKAMRSVGLEISKFYNMVLWSGTSQSGFPAMEAAALMPQEYAPHGLHIEGTPADPQKDPAFMNRLANSPFLHPGAILVGEGSLGKGRAIIPETIPRHYLADAPAEKSTQALDVEYACDMLHDFFRNSQLAHRTHRIDGERVRTDAYRGHLALMDGEFDTEICTKEQLRAAEQIMDGVASCMTETVPETHFGLLSERNWDRRVIPMLNAMRSLPRTQPV